jgi:hypothetical protein
VLDFAWPKPDIGSEAGAPIGSAAMMHDDQTIGMME